MKVTWWKSLGLGTLWLVTRIWAPMMALLFPALVIYGILHPRLEDIAKLDLSPSEVPLLVGVAGQGSVCHNGEPCEITEAQRSYLLPSRLLSKEGLVVVFDKAGSLRKEALPGMAFVIIGLWMLVVYISWRTYLQRPRGASNNRLEPQRHE